ncbi:DUF3857 and transglutaminase domain-containing protein [Flavobacteriaceae bacterium GSB9]|nr:DUF3857 and transglutaminase domain-containing protein [Flavobacteriaceae bacterium GSB9]
MNKITFLFLLLAFSLLSFSQASENNPVFRVSLQDLKMNTYPKDSTAHALVLYEYGSSHVDGREYDLRTEEKHKVKIFNKDGFDHATVTLYLYKTDGNHFEQVKDIVGTTYNLEGDNVVKTKLDKNNIYREEYNENITMVKFTLPNVKEGSVITYSYKIRSPYMRKYHGWEFQGDIPKLYSEYRTSIPANWVYNIKLVGGQKLATHKGDVKEKCIEAGGGSADCSEMVYAMKDIPAFIEEDYMTTRKNYLARLEYELETFKSMDGRVHHYTKTWEDVDKEIKKEKDIGKQLKKTLDIEELLPEDIRNLKAPLEKAKAIYKHVQKYYTWNGDFKIFKDVSVKDLIKNKSGNVSSVNILLNNLLRESGIKSRPVLLSTRANGFATKLYPVITDFNYLIVQATINEKTYLLDATDNYLSFGELPFRCLNQYGRLLDFDIGSKWIDIAPKKPSNTFYKADLNIDANQNITGSIMAKFSGYHALSTKKRYFSNKQTYIEKLQNDAPFIEISDHESQSKDKNDPTFSEKYNVEYNLDPTGETIYLNPILTKFFSSNPFKLQERTYPIDFGYKDTYFYMFSLKLDENYSVAELPKDYILRLPNNTGQLSFSSKQIGDNVTVMLKFSFKEAFYAPEYYPYLKEFMAKIIDKQNNSLILLKTNS